MIKKIIPIVIVGIMIFGGFGSIITTIADDKNTENVSISITSPVFIDKDEFTKVKIEESDTYLSYSGKPMLPVIVKTFSFPIGTQINDVTVNMETQQYYLEKKVIPTPIIIPDVVEVDSDFLEKEKFNNNVYSSSDLYPAEQYTIKYGVGLENMEHVIFVNVKCFVQYSPANNKLNIPTNININIDYETKETLTTNTPEETYDLIIITNDIFKDELQPLVAHKESHGITTKLVTVDEIYPNYDGVADWEDIKLYLVDHVLDWNTKYVLLAGGHIGQTNDWYVPDFRSHNWDPSEEYDPPYDVTYSSDLYFADLYKINGQGKIVIDTWDSNMNGIYAEGKKLESGTDIMDFYPDVAVGRLPMRYEWEADIAVDKIINYENNADDSWFKTAVLAGGDGFPPERYPGQATPGIYEGEISCDHFANLLANRGVTSTKCYCSDEGDIKVRGSEDVYNEVSKGCGFTHLTGHSCPFTLGSYEPNTGIVPPPIISFYTGFNARKFDSGYKLPFMINEGCHNAQFDVTGQDLIDYMFGEFPDFRSGRYEWVPHDVSSWFVLQKGGGAIAVIGNTGLGLGALDYGITKAVGGWLMLRFAEAWGVDEKNYTGSVWVTGISGYIDNFDVCNNDGDRKTIEERVLLGDPSIKLGGYGGSLSGSDDSEDNEKEYGQVSVSVPTWSVGDSWTYALDNIDINLSLTEERSILLKLSSGDIVLKVIDVTSDTYIASFTADNIDVSFGGLFDFHVEDVDNIEIPTINLDDIKIDGKLIIDKETLGILNVDLGLNFDIAKNLDNIGSIMGMEFPPFIDTIVPYTSIPADIDLDIEFENPFEIIHFPFENGDIWGIPANNVTITIDGSIKSIWLHVLNVVNKFVNIVPPEFAKYLPNIDISDVLNDYGINTTYQIDIPEVEANLLPYHDDTTPLFEAVGSESIKIAAGKFNAVRMSIIDDNGRMYYSESEGNIIKIIGYIGDYVPIIDDINIELKE